LARLDGTYRWGDTFDFGKTKMVVVPAPGHTPGFSVLYFPQDGVVYCSDIDLTSYGPWCQNSDQFITSAYQTAKLDADFFITGHEKGVVTREEFVNGLDKYLAVICQRDRRLFASLTEPASFAEIVSRGLFYGSRIREDEFLYCWEWTMDQEHLHRLIDQGRVEFKDGKYYRL
jgi:glyoxylase-like metal-dependent hydrolase (beta-lactamase superfamily II)